MGTGQAGHFTLWKSLCATYKDKRTTLAYSLEEKGTKMRRMYKGTSRVHSHNGPVHAGSQRVLLYSPPQCGIWSWRGLHRPPDAPWCAHSVQSAHTWLVSFLKGPEWGKTQRWLIGVTKTNLLRLNGNTLLFYSTAAFSNPTSDTESPILLSHSKYFLESLANRSQCCSKALASTYTLGIRIKSNHEAEFQNNWCHVIGFRVGRNISCLYRYIGWDNTNQTDKVWCCAT